MYLDDNNDYDDEIDNNREINLISFVIVVDDVQFVLDTSTFTDLMLLVFYCSYMSTFIYTFFVVVCKYFLSFFLQFLVIATALGRTLNSIYFILIVRKEN